MAKLARTLGENVPPELVFRPAPTPTSNSRLARSSSLFASFNAHVSGPAPPVLAVAATPTPPAPTSSVRAAPPTSTAGKGGAIRTTGKRRAARPRSLALGAASAIVAADAVLSRRAAASMDAPRVVNKAPAVEAVGLAPGDLGRRKEREWSGEWNGSPASAANAPRGTSRSGACAGHAGGGVILGAYPRTNNQTLSRSPALAVRVELAQSPERSALHRTAHTPPGWETARTTHARPRASRARVVRLWA
ncbi:hypothetical protein HYPSUDRAFT_219968 [Hypholoma sublateritium FD-334 SS-4]|uniref:Uncharacterized protein n=1 Tax=Hypholoma sublateritium (strain FD-334 SS-4) TaxID=945553 RepID=A0A0D2KLM7_HYPSF|nr:hypothetical protein HYPSUDRAFT_219968 [Hypholoma sublateritium FD-334 SS-4]